MSALGVAQGRCYSYPGARGTPADQLGMGTSVAIVGCILAPKVIHVLRICMLPYMAKGTLQMWLS